MKVDMTKFCKQCDKEFSKASKYSYRQWEMREYCSRTCQAKSLYGKKKEKFNHWRGGIVKTLIGYVYLHKPKHPFATQDGYVMEHRLVMEGYAGRFLESYEHVHHINGVKDDNRIENLRLMTIWEHNRFHALRQGLGRDEKSYRVRNNLGQFV